MESQLDRIMDPNRYQTMEQAYATQLIRELAGNHWRAIDKALVRFFQQHCPELSALWLLVAGETSKASSQGHLCLELQEAEAYLQSAGLPIPDWASRLQEANLLISVAMLDERPLVYASDAWYFRRFYACQQQIQAYLQHTSGQSQRLRSQMELPVLQTLLDGLFAAKAEPDWQRLACALSASSQFSVITGGPGTGKTTTVVKLLALLQQWQHQQQLPPLRLVLAAPTGKAAVRLRSSIQKALVSLALEPAIQAAVPTEVSTVHKLLGARPHSKNFYHNEHHPLALDLLVLDEASMLDVELFSALLRALPLNARLVLLGDKDQLASVEAGALLGSLCAFAAKGRYSSATLQWLTALSHVPLPAELETASPQALDQQIAMLRKSYRFSADSGISALAQAVNQGDLAQVQTLCQQQKADLHVLFKPSQLHLRQLVLSGQADGQGQSGFSHYLRLVQQGAEGPLHGANQDQWAQAVLSAFGRFQLLCAVRQGEFGVQQVNQQVELWLQACGLVDAHTQWYPGRPVLISQNDYGLGLMNGDVGICLRRDWQGKSVLAVAFASTEPGQAIRWVLPGRLPAHETAYAITVHKSQGSEFDHAVLLLPAEPSALLTRELVYTAITRAAKQFSLVCPEPQLLLQAVSAKTSRAGSLRLEL
ncbi:exodeoxyribonuclease V subunit alpha [Rheinheimera sp.]|uniref:exodeoxyribonuclease V subunit alpha n=1 Tax=Rheinheimera sp. TaxID=1869214 RepID=UPI00307CD47C